MVRVPTVVHAAASLGLHIERVREQARLETTRTKRDPANHNKSISGRFEVADHILRKLGPHRLHRDLGGVRSSGVQKKRNVLGRIRILESVHCEIANGCAPSVHIPFKLAC